MMLVIYTDGASRSNPGKSASGYLVLDSERSVLLEKSFYNGIKTNNEAEYLAIIGALESVAHEYGYRNELELYSDSELVIKQLNGAYRVKSHELRGLNGHAMELLRRFSAFRLGNVPREDRYITRVDKALNVLLDRY